jgi:hypothetical protein
VCVPFRNVARVPFKAVHQPRTPPWLFVAGLGALRAACVAARSEAAPLQAAAAALAALAPGAAAVAVGLLGDGAAAPLAALKVSARTPEAHAAVTAALRDACGRGDTSV